VDAAWRSCSARGYDLPVPRCYRVDTSAYRDDRSWFWFDRAKPRCRAAVRAMGESECCWGWADILYVPRPLLADFSALLGALPGIHHEVAVPTSLRLLSLRRNVTVRTLTCNGGAIGRMPGFAPTPRARNWCAHKMNLSSQRHEHAVRQMLGARW